MEPLNNVNHMNTCRTSYAREQFNDVLAQENGMAPGDPTCAGVTPEEVGAFVQVWERAERLETERLEQSIWLKASERLKASALSAARLVVGAEREAIIARGGDEGEGKDERGWGAGAGFLLADESGGGMPLDEGRPRSDTQPLSGASRHLSVHAGNLAFSGPPAEVRAPSTRWCATPRP